MAPSSRQPYTPEQNARILREIQALLPRYDSAAALGRVLGVTQGAMSALLTGKNGAGGALVRRLARILGKTHDEIVDGVSRHAGPRLRDLPGWDEAAREAMLLWAWLPLEAIEAAGATSALTLARPVTAEMIHGFAQVWASTLTPEELERQVDRRVLHDMEAEQAFGARVRARHAELRASGDTITLQELAARMRAEETPAVPASAVESDDRGAPEKKKKKKGGRRKKG